MKFDFSELEAFLTGYWISDLSNFSSFVATTLPDVNWAGFYLTDGQILRLGPFWGRPACMEIPFQRGVCGQAFSSRSTLRVDDVDSFPGHIRCDSQSRSEIVIPFFVRGEIQGVFDVDSPKLSRFGAEEQKLLEKAVEILSLKISGHPCPFGRLVSDF